MYSRRLLLCPLAFIFQLIYLIDPSLCPKDNTQPIYTENNRGVVYAELSVLFAKVKFKVFVFHWYNIREGIFFGYFLSLVDQMCKG